MVHDSLHVKSKPVQVSSNLNIIDEITKVLSLYADNSASDVFLQHVSLNPDIVEMLPTLSQSSQVNWGMRYWVSQFRSVGLNCDNFIRMYNDSSPDTVFDFIRTFGVAIGESANSNPIPNINTPIPQLLLRH